MFYGFTLFMYEKVPVYFGCLGIRRASFSQTTSAFKEKKNEKENL